MEPEEHVFEIPPELKRKSLSAKLAAVFETDNRDDKRKAFEGFEDANLFIENNELLSTSPENESSFPHSIASLKEILVEPLANCLLPADREEILAIFRASEERGDIDTYLRLAKEFQKNMKIAVDDNRSAYNNAQAQLQTPAPQTLPPTARPIPQFTQQATPPTQSGLPLQPAAPIVTVDPGHQYVEGLSQIPRPGTLEGQLGAVPEQQGLPPGQPGPNQYQAFPHLPKNLQKDALLAGLKSVLANTDVPTKQAVLNLLNPPSTGNFLSQSNLTSASFDQLKSFVVQTANCFGEPQKSEILRTFSEKENNLAEYRSLAVGLRANLNLALTLYKEMNPNPEEPADQQSEYITLPGWSTESLFAGLKTVDENYEDDSNLDLVSRTARLNRENFHVFETDNKAQNILLLELNQGNAQEFVRNCASCFISPHREEIEAALNSVKENPQACLALAKDLQEDLLIAVATYTNTPLAESAQAEQPLPLGPRPIPRAPGQQPGPGPRPQPPAQQAQQFANVTSSLNAQARTFGAPNPSILSSPHPTGTSAALRLSAPVNARASATAHTNTEVDDEKWKKIKKAVKESPFNSGKIFPESDNKISVNPRSGGIGVDITRHNAGLDVSTSETPPGDQTLRSLVTNYKIAANVLGINECEISQSASAENTATLILELASGDKGWQMKPIITNKRILDELKAMAAANNPICQRALETYERLNPTPKPASPSPI